MARGSCRRRCPAPGSSRSSALPWYSANWRASTTGTYGSSSPCRTRSGRGASRRAAGRGRKRRNSLAQASNDGGKAGWRMAPSSRACSRKRRGWAAQSSKSARAPSIATPRTRASSAPTHTAKRAAGVGPDQPDAVGLRLALEVVDGRPQVVDPALEREVPARLAAPAEGERHGRPAELVGDAVHQLGEGPAGLTGVERPEREPVAEDQRGQRRWSGARRERRGGRRGSASRR